MKTILIFVSTLDGKITRWGNPKVSLWSSHQDHEYYMKVLRESPVVVMGSNTFKADTFKPTGDQQIIIMTSHSERYRDKVVPGHFEFTDESPRELFNRFNNRGFQQMLVVGGPHVATSFLQEQLIDELWLTLEPRIFGSGGNFVTEFNLDVALILKHCEVVNEQGTLITRYSVLKK
jgi:dihydrofolate reductase